MLVALAWLYPHAFADANRSARANARLDNIDRALGGGNSVLPAQAIAMEARGRIPEDGTFAVSVGPRQPAGASSRSPTRWRTTCGTPPAAADGSERAVDPLLRLRPERLSRRAGRLGGLARCTRDPEATVVTVRALAGLAALNVAYAVVGLSLLWGRSRFARGAACSGSPGSGTCSGSRRSASSGRRSSSRVFRSGAVVVGLSLVVLTAAGLVAGRLRGAGFDGGRPHLGAGPILLVSAASVALAGLFLEALFRTARLSSLQEYDAWAFWVPKGLAIFFFDGLDAHVFTTAPNATYPPLQPVLDAAAFHAMGGPDVVTLHVQFWFLVVGAVAAVAGLLHRHAPAWLLWPPLLLVLVVRASASGCSRPRPTSCSRCSSSSRPCSSPSGSATGATGASGLRRCCSPRARTRSARASSWRRRCSRPGSSSRDPGGGLGSQRHPPSWR